MARFVVNEIFFSPGYPRVSFVRTSHDARPGCSVYSPALKIIPGLMQAMHVGVKEILLVE